MSETKTLSFRLNSLDKERAESIIKTISDKRKLSKPDSFIYLLDDYNKRILLDGKTNVDYIPPNISDVLNSINCDYLVFRDDLFQCFEDYHKKKDTYSIGIEPETVRMNCLSCLKGKSDIIERKIQDERRKESFKRIETLARQLLTITEKGFMTNVQLCTYNILDGNLTYSRDNETLICGLQDNDLINIQDRCMKALNNKTSKPPCQYLITLEHLSQISKEDIKKMNIELPQIQYEEEEIIQDIKTVDAEYEVKEEDKE